ncbi:hypothetical protein [Mesorhizobium sp. B3-1-6]|nr:hypothetical protein [Mesorhizobium sp. B3-1-6]
MEKRPIAALTASSALTAIAAYSWIAAFSWSAALATMIVYQWLFS